jgi:hypothetical protein
MGLLAEPDSVPPTSADAIARLRAVVQIDPQEQTVTPPTGEVESLLARRRELHDDLSRAEADEALIREFRSDQQAFAAEISEQRARLGAIGLYDHEHDGVTCPVCNSLLGDPDPTTEVLAAHLRRLDEELGSVADVEPRDRETLRGASQRTAEVSEELRVVNGALRDLAQRDRSVAKARDLASERSYLQGSIAEYLRTLGEEDISGESRLREQIAALESERADLEGRVDTEAQVERLSGALNLIGADMTAIARRLGLEHSDEGQVRLDLPKMTLVADTVRDGSFPLRGIGGGGTRVGYHLAAHLALHRLLRGRDRPGPAFLILDQPTGPFYPEDPPEEAEPEIRDEDDRVIVASIFELLRDVADELKGSLQIIVCDHARFEEPWFEKALVENWRQGKGLIPDDWEADNNPTEVARANP